jgi:hypothetical protein
MRAFAFAWRSLLRRRGRSALGILGIAAAGALMFDMLLLSRGLLVSVKELLDAFGFDVRVLASEGLPQARTPIDHAFEAARRLAALPEVASAVPFRIGEAEIAAESERPEDVALFAVGSTTQRIWTIVDGRDLSNEENGARAVLGRAVDSAAGQGGDCRRGVVPLRVGCSADDRVGLRCAGPAVRAARG